MNKMVLSVLAMEEIDVLLSVDEEGELKSWNLHSNKFIQKIQLKM